MVEFIMLSFSNVLLFVIGAVLVYLTLRSAIQTFILPRSARDPLVTFVFNVTRKIFDFRLRTTRDYARRDRIMAFYAPLSLMCVLLSWYLLVMFGYTLMFHAIGVDDWYLAFRDSGSSLLTLGFESAHGLPQSILAFSEAMIGLLLVALLISYLPAMYSAFSQRETAVTLLEVRAGDPPSPTEMIKRYHRIHGMNQLGEVWRNWEVWFAELHESHTSLGMVAFFRSPEANHSWVTASGVILDTASLVLSVVKIPYDAQAALCIRAGYLALRQIANFFELPFNPNPKPTDRISIRREEFDAVCAELEASGVPLLEDRDQAWRDFAGWRVNYDQSLLGLARLTMSPHAMWSSDREM